MASHAETGTGKLTVGKLYGGILIYDCWKKTKFGQIEVLRQQEAELQELERKEKEADRAQRRQEAIDRGEDPDQLIFTSDEDEDDMNEGGEGGVRNNGEGNGAYDDGDRRYDDDVGEYYPEDEDDYYGRRHPVAGGRMAPIIEYEDEYDLYERERNDPYLGRERDYHHQERQMRMMENDGYNSSYRRGQFNNYGDYSFDLNNRSHVHWGGQRSLDEDQLLTGRENRIPFGGQQLQAQGQTYPGSAGRRLNGVGRKLPQTPKTPSAIPTQLLQTNINNHVPHVSFGGSHPNLNHIPNGGIPPPPPAPVPNRAPLVNHIGSAQGIGRKLPPTPNKPSTLFSNSRHQSSGPAAAATSAFQSLSERLSKPASLSFR